MVKKREKALYVDFEVSDRAVVLAATELEKARVFFRAYRMEKIRVLIRVVATWPKNKRRK